MEGLDLFPTDWLVRVDDAQRELLVQQRGCNLVPLLAKGALAFIIHKSHAKGSEILNLETRSYALDEAKKVRKKIDRLVLSMASHPLSGFRLLGSTKDVLVASQVVFVYRYSLQNPAKLLSMPRRSLVGVATSMKYIVGPLGFGMPASPFSYLIDVPPAPPHQDRGRDCVSLPRRAMDLSPKDLGPR